RRQGDGVDLRSDGGVHSAEFGLHDVRVRQRGHSPGVAMSEQWYYVCDGREFGPASADSLKRLAAVGRLQRGDVVRRAEEDDWLPAGAVQGLFDETQPGHADVEERWQDQVRGEPVFCRSEGILITPTRFVVQNRIFPIRAIDELV